MGVNVNTGTPAGYMNPWQMMMQNMYGNLMQPQQQMQQPQQPTSPPMIHADMIETPSEDWARNFNMGPGQTQIFYTRDESAMYVKSTHANDSGYDFDIYLRQAPKPAPEYMTREQVEAMIREAKEAE